MSNNSNSARISLLINNFDEGAPEEDQSSDPYRQASNVQK